MNTLPNEADLSSYSGKKVDWSRFKYPIESCLKGYGGVVMKTNHSEEISMSDLLDTKKLEQSTIYFHQYGTTDTDPWVLIVKQTDGQNGIYVYFNSACDYLGFECRGYANINYTTEGWDQFWNKCLDTYGRSHLTYIIHEKMFA